MNGIGKSPFTTIFILTDVNGKVYYSNINNADVIKGLLRTANINKLFNTGNAAKKEIDDYIITADKLSIDDKILWVLTAEIEDSYKPYEDFSTGLYNRNYWEHLKSGIVKLPFNGLYSLIVIDIDNLKECNDLYGHVIGDGAIAMVGEAILNSVRENDVPIHYGGDEYIIILPNTDSAGSKKVIDRIRNEISKKGVNEKLKIEISAGASYSDNISNLEQVLQSADRKMYCEKRRKKKMHV